MASPKDAAFNTKDKRDDFPIFIHSELDDYGLTPIEFRVYSRLARRAGQNGKHSESVPNMAQEFEVSDRTIQRALKLLVACGLISRHSRPGKTDEYSLNPRSVWRNRKHLKDIRAAVIGRGGDTTAGGISGDTRAGGDMRDTGVVTPRTGVVVTPETDEGTPSEGTPFKVEEDRGYPFDHFAVIQYCESFKTELAIFQAETIAVSVEDTELSRAVWADVVRTFTGNGYQKNHAGNAVDRYIQDMRKIASGKKESPLPQGARRVETLKEQIEREARP